MPPKTLNKDSVNPFLQKSNIADIYALSPMQQGMLFHALYEPASPVYFEQFTMTLQGALDVRAFEQAWNHLIAANPILRTVFRWKNLDQPAQVVLKEYPVALVLRDLAAADEAAQQQAIQAFLREDRGAPFALDEGPLMRLHLFALGKARHFFVWSFHHIILDGWSLPILIGDLTQVYQALIEHRPAPKAARRPYREYIAWLQRGDTDAARAFWREYLAGIETPTPLPLAMHGQPRAQVTRVDDRALVLSAALSAGLEAAARQYRITLNALIQTAWAVLLGRISGEPEVVFGATLSGRPPELPGAEGMIGLLINTLPLRLRVDAHAPFRALAQTLQAHLLKLQEFQFTPLAQVRALSAMKGGVNLFNSIVVFENFPVHKGKLGAGALTVEDFSYKEMTNFPLTLIVSPHGERLGLQFFWDPSLFSDSAIQQLTGHFTTLLENIAQHPDRALHRLHLMSPAQRAQVLDDFNATTRDYDLGHTLIELIEAQVRKTPQAAALRFEEQSLTYAQLDARANRLAHYLKAQGVGPDTLVAVMLARGVDLVVALLAVLKAGGAYLPLDPEYPPARLDFMLSDAGPKVLLTHAALRERLPSAATPTLCLDTAADFLAAYPQTAPGSAATPAHLAYVIYTSGSTGRPKGVCIPHAGICNRLLWMQEQYRLGADDRVLQKTPISFDVSVWEFFWPLIAGAQLVLARPGGHQDPGYLVDLIVRTGVTTLHFVPSMLQMFLQAPGVEACTSLQRIICSGEALPVELQDQCLALFGPRLHNLYGPTEASVDVSYWACRTEGARTVPIGYPIANTGLYILDPQLSPVPVGVAGELYIGGIGLARAYLHRPDLTAERFLPHPFSQTPGARIYSTGDFARYRADGAIEFLGRRDHQVKIRGQRIELGEIESTLARHPAVRSTAVLARGEGAEKRLVAYVVAPDADAGGLRRFAQGLLPPPLVPQAFVFLDALPLTPNGKLDRAALPAPDGTRPDVSALYAPPRTPAESLLARIWTEVLKLDKAGIHDNFFDLGGDSILSIQIVARLHQQGWSVQPKEIFQYQTIAALAPRLHEKDRRIEIDQRPVSGDAPLAPIQHWFFEQALDDRHHWNHALLLKSRTPVDPAALETALQALLDHHDALRMRYRHDHGQWRQHHLAIGEKMALEVLKAPPNQAASWLEAQANRLQAGLDLTQGPLMRAGLFHFADGEERLLIIIHHLLVDGISWRILLADLTLAYAQARAGAPLRLPPKTHSFQAWTEALQDYAQSESLLKELPYWQALLKSGRTAIGVDHDHGANTVGSGATVTLSLSAAQTQALLTEARKAYRTEANDLLLTALMRGLKRWRGIEALLLHLEGHGREDLPAALDIGRTVGWFTSLFPVRLQIEGDDPGAQIKQIKETLRAVPHKGLGYGVLKYLRRAPALQAGPAVEMSFNYLGQFDPALDGEPFHLAAEPSGAAISARNLRAHLIDINAMVSAGTLTLSFTYSRHKHREATMLALANAVHAELDTVIGHCLHPDHSGWTPSDVPLLQMTQKDLDALPAQTLDVYGLAPAQHGMLFHAVYAPRSAVYFEQFTYHLEGVLHLRHFAAAWEQVVANNAILRTVFRWQGLAQPVQLVLPQMQIPLHVHSLLGQRKALQEQTVRQFLETDRNTSFDLGNGPLMRLNLFQLAENRFTFVWSLHHILMDGWCLPVLMGDLFKAYMDLLHGTPLQLPQRRPYKDYIDWLARKDLTASREFWRAYLQGIEAPTQLPVDYHTAAQDNADNADNASLSLDIDPRLTAKLIACAKDARVTLSTLFQAAWAILLSRYCGQAQVVFGVTVAGRPAEVPGIETMLGLFINTLPLRAAVDEGRPLTALLDQLQAHALAVQEHAYVNLADIQNDGVLRGASGLFNSILVFENYPVDIADTGVAAQDGGVRVSGWSAREMTNYPATVLVSLGAQLRVQLLYRQDAFKPTTAGNLLQHYKNLLRAIAAAPDAHIARLSMLSGQERERLLQELALALDTRPSVQGEFPEVCLQHLFEAQVAKTPQAVAVVFQDQSLTYAELNTRANRLAHYLRGLGVGRETLVGVCLERSLEMIVGLFGILKAGGAYVPLDPNYPQERLAFMLEDTQAPVLLTQARLLDAIPSSGPSSGARVVCLDRDWPAIGEQPAENPGGAPLSTQLAYVIYTSGSTGQPKGVGIQHRSAVVFLSWARGVFPAESLKGVLFSTSICFDLSVFELFLPLTEGGKVILAEHALQLPQLAAAQEVTLINTVPSAIAELARARAIPASVTTINLAGEPLKHSLVRQLYSQDTIQHVFNLYGPSEDTTYSTFVRIDRNDDAAPTIGRPIAHTRVYILDAYLNPVPLGVAGELYIGGEGLARGYLRRPALTAEKFIPDPFGTHAGARLYRTGDLVRYRPDGNIEFLGRLDHQVKIRGFRIELGEIESVLAAHPEIREAAVTVHQEASGEKRLIAHFAARAKTPVDIAALRGFLRQKLPDYMVPAAFIPLEALPLTLSGKIDRKALQASRDFSVQRSAEYVPPRTETERYIAQIWREVLGVKQIGVHDNFFDLGGHSLSAMQVVAKLKGELQTEISLRTLFDAPTVAAIAAVVAAAERAHYPAIAPVDARDYYPLSHAQRRLWFLVQLDPQQTGYNMPMALRLKGPFDAGALTRAFQAVVQRHSALRTTFITVNEQPMQWIAESMAVNLPIVDLRSGDVAKRDAELKRQATEEAQTPFNLETGPLLRGKILRLGDDEHALLLTMHHIVSDGWSMEVLVDEVTRLYAALLSGADKTAQGLPALAVQYVDYALWQNALLANGALQAQRDYWLRQLGGELPTLQLPTDRPRPPVQTFNGDRAHLAIDENTCTALHALCRQHNVTLFMLLAAVYQVLLSKLSGQEDIIVGTPIAGRHYAQTERLIGFFVNTLALRANLAGDPRFSDLLKTVRETTLQAFAHQDYPFDLLVDDLQTTRDLSRQALFSAVFAFQNKGAAAGADRPRDSGVHLEPLPVDFRQAKFDLTLNVSERPQGLALEFEYNTDLFDAHTIERWLGYLRNLIEAVIASPAATLSALPLLSEPERVRLLYDFNPRPSAAGEEACLHRLFEAQVQRTPDAPAVVFENQKLSYRELNVQANQLAHYLIARGVGPEVLVALCMGRSPQMLVAILGVLKAGGAYVPMDPEYPQERLKYILDDTRAPLLLTHSEAEAQVANYAGSVIALDRDRPAIAACAQDDPVRAVQPDNLAYVIYTSGSTGKPKGTLLEHRNVSRLMAACQRYYGFTSADVWTLFHSYCFDFSVWEIFGALLYGGKVVVVPKLTAQSPSAYLTLLEEQQVSVLNQTPSAFVRLLDVAGNRESQSWGKALRYIIFGGEALDLGAIRPWFTRRSNPATRLVNMYGITETTVHVTYRAVGDKDPAEDKHLRSVGRPLAHLRAYILDKFMHPVPVGVVGELYIGGAGLARGYLERPALSAERFVPDPFGGQAGARLYRTGDLARYLPDGEIEYLGRIDHQVKIRGYRIELKEIEIALNQHPQVNDCVVTVAADRGKRPFLVAFYAADGALPVSVLRTFLMQGLPDYMLPTAFVHLKQLPLTANGKVDRKALVYEHDARPELGVAYLGARNEIEAKLVPLWQEVLGLDQVGVHDNFFDLGGESFSAYRLMARISEEFHKEVPLASIFEAQTVELLAAKLAGHIEEQDDQALVMIQPGAPERLPFFCVHPAGGDVLGFQHLARELGKDQPFYGLQSLGRFLGDRYHATLEEMAQHYLQEIFALQPHGPYIIGGHSLGGKIAFEMARQLEEMGKEVGLLAIFDAEIVTRDSSMLETLLLVSDTFGLQLSRADLKQVEGTKMMDQVLKEVKKKFGRVLEIAYEMDILPRGFRTKDAELFFNRIATNIDLAAAYVPRPIKTKVTMFLAMELSEHGRPLDLDSWRPLALSGMDVIPVPGNHLNLVKLPHVKTLAGKLREMLNRINKNAQSQNGARLIKSEQRLDPVDGDGDAVLHLTEERPKGRAHQSGE